MENCFNSLITSGNFLFVTYLSYFVVVLQKIHQQSPSIKVHSQLMKQTMLQ